MMRGGLRAHVAKSRGLLLGIALAGAACSTGAYFLARNADDARVRAVLDLRAEWRARDFERKLSLAVNDVGALAALMMTEGAVDAATFTRYAELQRWPADGYSSLIWAPLVKAADRASFIASVRQKTITDYDITQRLPDGRFVPAGGHEEFLPILYLVSFEPQLQSFGVDLMAQAERRQIVNLARDEGRPTASPPLTLLSSPDQVSGFFVYWPVYATSKVPATVTDRHGAFRGAVVAACKFGDLFPDLIAGTPAILEAIDIYIDRGTADAASSHIARFDPVTQRFAIGATTPVVEAGSVTLIRDFDVLGRRWTLESHFAPALIASLRGSDLWTWPAFGLVLTALVMAFAERERWRRAGVEAVVTERTAALSAANERLSQQIGERLQAEERADNSQALMKATFDASPVAIVVRDPNFNVLLWNRAAEQIFGYSAEEALGRRLPLFADPAGEEQIEAAVQRLVEGQVLRGIEQKRRRKNGSLIDVSFSGAPIYVDGKFAAFVGIVEDVTERRAVARQLVQAQKMEAIGNLTGGMAHDFNNLLGIIVGNLDLLLPLLRSNPEAEELANAALDSALHGADLTQHLLAFARRQSLQPELTDLNKLVSDTGRLLSRILDANISLAFHLAPEIWPVVVDRAQLESSLINLATNARDAMPQGGTLSIATGNRVLDADYCAAHAAVAQGDYATIEVSDTGTGMSPELVSRIFEPFFTTKETGEGTGLGLSMVFGFMKQSGGHINVYSELGEGTTFRLYLPRDDGAASTRQRDEEKTPLSARGETILVVEDNASLRHVVIRQLVDLGYRTIEAADAASALVHLDSETVDLLFTDIVMPGGLNGFDLARKAIEANPRLKVVLTSGFPGAKIDGHLGALAASARLLTKPYRKSDLAHTLRAALDAIPAQDHFDVTE